MAKPIPPISPIKVRVVIMSAEYGWWDYEADLDAESMGGPKSLFAQAVFDHVDKMIAPYGAEAGKRTDSH